MIDAAIRLAKGAYMALAFGLFAFGIGLSLLFVVPFCALFPGVSRVHRTRHGIRALLRFWLRIMALGGLVQLRTVTGEPAPGPCVMVSNHPGLFDILFLICNVPNLSVLVKPTLATRLPLKPVFRALDYVVASDGLTSTTLESLFQLRERLEAGWRVFLFPEGTRSPKGGVGTFRAGAFRLARLANVPVQPVFIRNVPPFMPHEDRWFLPPRSISTVDLEFWPPLQPIHTGEERTAAHTLEGRFRQTLTLPSAPDNPPIHCQRIES